MSFGGFNAPDPLQLQAIDRQIATLRAIAGLIPTALNQDTPWGVGENPPPRVIVCHTAGEPDYKAMYFELLGRLRQLLAQHPELSLTQGPLP